MKIAILGTRGIPNRYGGFEQITEWLSAGLAQRGHELSVYNSHNHPNQEKRWNDVNIIHCYDPEYLIKTAGQFVYDLNCIRDASKRNFDVLLFMGYTSSSVWARFFPKKTMVISNMDGFEWKRTKYSRPVRGFLKYAESLAVKHSHFHIADSKIIKEYIRDKYQKDACYIPYGPCVNEIKSNPESAEKNSDYFLLMARMEPENNIEMILEGFLHSKTDKKFIVVGNTNTAYGKMLLKKFNHPKIKFTGGLFDQDALFGLKKNAALYFHGHSVGGTNPSLLEAMHAGVLIAAHKNPFNQSVLGGNAFYFSSAADVTQLLEQKPGDAVKEKMISNNYEKLETEFNREKVIVQYEDFITECFNQFTK